MLKKANLFVFPLKSLFQCVLTLPILQIIRQNLKTMKNYSRSSSIFPYIRKKKSELNLLAKKWSIINHDSDSVNSTSEPIAFRHTSGNASRRILVITVLITRFIEIDIAPLTVLFCNCPLIFNYLLLKNIVSTQSAS